MRRIIFGHSELWLAITLVLSQGCGSSPQDEEPEGSGGSVSKTTRGGASSAGNASTEVGGATAAQTDAGGSTVVGGASGAIGGASPLGTETTAGGEPVTQGGTPGAGGTNETGSTSTTADSRGGSSNQGGAAGASGTVTLGGKTSTSTITAAGRTSLGGASAGGASSKGGAGGIGPGGTNATYGGVGGGGSACLSGSTVLCTPKSGISLADSDCDGIADSVEIGSDAAHPVDTDGDGKPDYLDDDSDADGILDNVEVGSDCSSPRDSDGDTIFDFRDLDSDGNGIADKSEAKSDTDGDKLPDYADPDDDGDLLPDSLEIGSDVAHPLDTDGDGTPDFKDPDSDGDTIMDGDERAGDPDGDGLPNHRDLDSDGDGILDAIEAGDTNPTTPPVDTDGDGLMDFVDVDSDGDGLPDAREDLDHDGVVDTGESSRVKVDSDGDGVSDLVEVTAGTDPLNAADNPSSHGNFFFTEPYDAPPSPSKGTFDFATKISRADIFFLMDTTGSMSGAISGLTSSLSTSIIPTLAAQISSIGIGIGSFRDFPTGSYGSSGDLPFKLEHRIMTVSTSAGIASVQARVTALAAGGGGDGPEAAWEALHQVATGAGNSTGGATVPAFNAATAYPTTAVPGESLGTLPGVGFRTGALPIVTYITDVEGHNSDTSTVASSPYASPVTSVRSTQAINELKAISARVIGVDASGSASSSARADQLSVINATNTYVPPSAWGTGSSRPTGCSAAQCCTGLSGAGEVANSAGNCPLSFLFSSSGTGLGTTIVSAIQMLTTFGTINIGARAVDDPSDSVNAVSSFIDAVVANPTAGAPCDTGLTATDTNGDGRLDTFVGVKPGKRVCFDVLPKTNLTVLPTTAPQVFKAAIEVVGDSVTVVDTRNVFFLVPPAIQ